MNDESHWNVDPEQLRLEKTVLHLHGVIEQLALHRELPWTNTPEVQALTALRDKIVHQQGGDQQPSAELSSAIESMTNFLRQIEKSSLGTPASHRIRRLSSAHTVAAILARADDHRRESAYAEHDTTTTTPPGTSP